MQSVVQSLTKIGKKKPLNLPRVFQTCPQSVYEAMRMISLPKPNVRKKLKYWKIFGFSAGNPQGIAYAFDDTWFLASEKTFHKYTIKGPDLYEPTSIKRIKKVSLNNILNPIGFGDSIFDHIGDIDYSDGLLVAPLRNLSNKKMPMLLALSKNLELVAYAILKGGAGDSWCAFNPWNNLLYTPKKGDNGCFLAYDVSAFYDIFKDRSSWGTMVELTRRPDKTFYLYDTDGKTSVSVSNIQGIAFSPNGRLYIPRYSGSGPWYNYIHVYSGLTGARLGTSPEYNFPDYWDEIEGISIHPSGYIYVAVAINQNVYGDRFEVYVFHYTEPTQI